MTSKLELYKCKVCTNLIEVVKDGVGTLVCCNEEMNLLQTLMPNEADAHYAHLEILDEMTKKITFNHPMNQEHYIEFIEVISKDEKYVKRTIQKSKRRRYRSFGKGRRVRRMARRRFFAVRILLL